MNFYTTQNYITNVMNFTLIITTCSKITLQVSALRDIQLYLHENYRTFKSNGNVKNNNSEWNKAQLEQSRNMKNTALKFYKMHQRKTIQGGIDIFSPCLV